jgi:hypothetical protein
MAASPSVVALPCSERRFRCRQDLDSTHSLCGLVQGAEVLPRSRGAPDVCKCCRAGASFSAVA